MGHGGRVDADAELARIKRHDRHFLDANLLIGYSVKWDQQNPPCKFYFKQYSPDYMTSERVHEEARGVIEDCRRQTLQVATHVAEEFEAGLQSQLFNDIHRFIDGHFEDLKSPVKEYVDHNRPAFRTLARDPPESEIERVRDQIRDDYRTPLSFLNKLRYESDLLSIWEDAPADHRQTYNNHYYSLDDIMSNTDDRDLLFDAYDFVFVTGRDDLLVVTLDRSDFVEDRDSLEETLAKIEIADLLGLYRQIAARQE